MSLSILQEVGFICINLYCLVPIGADVCACVKLSTKLRQTSVGLQTDICWASGVAASSSLHGLGCKRRCSSDRHLSSLNCNQMSVLVQAGMPDILVRCNSNIGCRRAVSITNMFCWCIVTSPQYLSICLSACM